MKSLLRQMYRLLSARWTIFFEMRSVDRRMHKQSRAQIGGEDDKVTLKMVMAGTIIVGCLFLVIFIEGAGKPDPKTLSVEVRK